VLRRIAFVTLLLAIGSRSVPARVPGCPGTPLACVGSGHQTLVVAIGLPPHALGILVGGPRAGIGPRFGSGRWCVATPHVRLASTCADADGTALVRLEGRPPVSACSEVQILWRDRLSAATGTTATVRLPCPQK
jgi:hypothetical protein